MPTPPASGPTPGPTPAPAGRRRAGGNRSRPPHFYHRLLRAFSLSMGLIAVSLCLGIAGYRFIAGLPWPDAFLNASMILSGMGPVDVLDATSAKIFAGCYALFSGVVFITASGIILSPLMHRVLHRFHVEDDTPAE